MHCSNQLRGITFLDRGVERVYVHVDTHEWSTSDFDSAIQDSAHHQNHLIACKTPVGVEPTEDGFAGRRHAVWTPASLSVPARNRTWSTSFAGSRAIRHTPETDCEYPAEESNPVRRLRRPSCDHHTRRASIPTWTRTKGPGTDRRKPVGRFGESNAIR